MNKEERLRELDSLKRRYLILRELIVYYENEYLKLREEHQEVKEEVKVKKLVLKKSFYGNDLVVGKRCLWKMSFVLFIYIARLNMMK